MSDNEFAEQDLLKLFEQGVAKSAGMLAQISHTNWSTQTVSIKMAPLEKLQTAAGVDDKDYYGVCFTMPGGVFLVMFPERSGAVFAEVFLPPGARQAGGLRNPEQESLAEISNIMINAVAATIADACDQSFFLSSPKVSRGKKQDLLRAAPGLVSPAGEKFTIMAYVHMSSAEISSDCSVAVFLSAAWKERLLAAL